MHTASTGSVPQRGCLGHSACGGTPRLGFARPRLRPQLCPGARPAVACRASYKVRYGKSPDIEGVAHVCGEAFGSGNFPGMNNPELVTLEERYMASIVKDVREKLQVALDRKRQATLLHRELRLRRMAAQLQEAVQGRRRTLSKGPSLDEQKAERKWIRQRMFVCLVAECKETGQIVGTASMSIMQPEALLPAPFPSTVPHRAYLYNMCVLPQHRRQGVARALVQACMRTARLWGSDSLWLHVRSTRTTAVDLYMQQGFRPAQRSGFLPSAKDFMGESLLKVDLPPRRRPSASSPQGSLAAGQSTGPTHTRQPQQQQGSELPGPSLLAAHASSELGVDSSESEGEEVVVDGDTRSDGVFVWDVSVKEASSSADQQQQVSESQHFAKASGS